MTPEFARPERVDTIGEGAREVTVEAGAAEREALARRFGLISIERLAGTFSLRREAAGIAVTGRVQAEVTQACTATGEPLAASVDEPVSLCFVEEQGSEEELELSTDAVDVIGYEGGAVDLGEAAAETMVLALDPFPRGPGAEEALREAGVLQEEDAAPLSGLAAALKDKLAKR